MFDMFKGKLGRQFTVESNKVRSPKGLAQFVLGLHSYHSIQVLCRWKKQDKQLLQIKLALCCQFTLQRMNENLLTI